MSRSIFNDRAPSLQDAFEVSGIAVELFFCCSVEIANSIASRILIPDSILVSPFYLLSARFSENRTAEDREMF